MRLHFTIHSQQVILFGVEGVYKTKDAFYGIGNKLLNKSGSTIFTSLSYSKKGIGVNLQFKRTENFQHNFPK